jgi:hypothetical protein
MSDHTTEKAQDPLYLAPRPTPPMICSFALHGGRYCQRPAGHERDEYVPRHDSTPTATACVADDGKPGPRCTGCAGCPDVNSPTGEAT